MSQFVERRIHSVSSRSGRPRTQRGGVEEGTDDNTDAGNNTRNNNSGDTEFPGLPPNENLKKNADEAYGDTEIPERKNDV
jgi:hypothetical protein